MPTQMIAVGIDLEVERALGMIGLQHRDRIVRHLAGLGIELGEELLAEVRVPDAAVGIDDDVVRLDLLPRQIVFGDDDARGAAAGARRKLEFEAVLGLGREIERREIGRERLAPAPD